MKRHTRLLIAVATLAGVVAVTVRAPQDSEAQQAASIFVTKIPSGYRDWRLISVAHEEGDLHSFAAVLGNDAAMRVSIRLHNSNLIGGDVENIRSNQLDDCANIS